MELKGIKTVSHANGDYYWFVGSRTVYLVKCAINTFNIELGFHILCLTVWLSKNKEAWFMTREIIIPIFA